MREKKEEFDFKDIKDIKDQLAYVITIVNQQQTKKESSVETFAIIKALKDQIVTMNEMNSKFVEQSNDNYVRVETKVDDMNDKLEILKTFVNDKIGAFQNESRELVKGITELTIDIRKTLEDYDRKIMNVEGSIGHLAGENCDLKVKTFCEEMQGKEETIVTLISKEEGKKGAFNEIKRGFFSSVGGTALVIATGIMFLILVGSVVMLENKISQIQKTIQVNKITP